MASPKDANRKLHNRRDGGLVQGLERLAKPRLADGQTARNGNACGKVRLRVSVSFWAPFIMFEKSLAILLSLFTFVRVNAYHSAF